MKGELKGEITMATIEYKEKYEKAVQAAMQAKQDIESAITIGILEEIFPELRESEDEIIRKVLLAYFKNELKKHGNEEWDWCIHTTDVIAWLEKQCDKDKFIEKELGCIKGYREKAIKRLKELEKQCDQKSAWSEEDERIMNAIYKFLDGSDALSVDQQQAKYWFKSLKDRVVQQPKQEWSMQDEEELNIVLNTLREAGQNDSAHWLKNVCLIPKNTWKPSDEQIDALDFAIDCTVLPEFCIKRKVLKELLKQLKKL